MAALMPLWRSPWWNIVGLLLSVGITTSIVSEVVCKIGRRIVIRWILAASPDSLGGIRESRRHERMRQLRLLARATTPAGTNTTMDKSRILWRVFSDTASKRTMSTATQRPSWICTGCLRQQAKPSKNIFRQQRRKQSTQPGDDPTFTSIVDNPPQLIRSGRKHNKIGLFILAAIPVTAFVLGCWQVQRLGWKSELIARFEDRLLKDPLPLPPQVDPDAIKDFDYRRVVARGVLRHDQEMLIGPRVHDGQPGYQVVTPLDRSDEFPGNKGNSTVLINRGWIPKDKADHRQRPEGLPQGTVVVEGLLREPWKKNMFTPDNKPAEGKFYFPDVYEMAAYAGSQAVWIEETMRPDLLESYAREDKGVPIGRPPEVNLRNNHGQVSLSLL
jgi:surfeit locus 1 family protein